MAAASYQATNNQGSSAATFPAELNSEFAHRLQLGLARCDLLQSIMHTEGPQSGQYAMVALRSALLQKQHSSDSNGLDLVLKMGEKGLLITAVLLLHLVSELQPRNGHVSSLGPTLVNDNRFLTAFQAEVHRIRRLISSCYEDLLARVSELGKLLPAASNTCDQPPDNATKESNAQDPLDSLSTTQLAQAAEEYNAAVENNTLPSEHKTLSSEQLAVLRLQSDQVAADTVLLDDFIRHSISSLADVAQQYDHMVADHMKKVNNRTKSNGMADIEPVKDQSAGGHTVLLTAVCSHSSVSSTQGRYTAGVAPDVYHQSLYRLLTHATSAEPVLWGLSVCYARIKHLETAASTAAQPASTANNEWTAPDKFSRTTTKYWVHPNHVMRVKVLLLQQLPLLVYGKKSPLFIGDISSADALKTGSHGVSSLITSVYLDSNDLKVYHARLRREDGARLLRLRWYGTRRPDDASQVIYVEKKTHRERWTGERSVKERSNVQQGLLAGFLAGSITADRLGSKKPQLLQQVQEYVIALEQVRQLRSEYYRTAWQRYDSNTIRFSLDEHMLLIRERGAHVLPGDWCAAAETAGPLAGGDVVRFPYAILEIKLQEEKPTWVQELLDTGLLVEVPRFSKFLHGVALLFPAACTNSPSWFLPDAAGGDHMTPATIEEMSDKTDQYRKDAAPWMFPPVPTTLAAMTSKLSPAHPAAAQVGESPSSPYAVKNLWQKLLGKTPHRNGTGSSSCKSAAASEQPVEAAAPRQLGSPSSAMVATATAVSNCVVCKTAGRHTVIDGEWAGANHCIPEGPNHCNPETPNMPPLEHLISSTSSSEAGGTHSTGSSGPVTAAGHGLVVPVPASNPGARGSAAGVDAGVNVRDKEGGDMLVDLEKAVSNIPLLTPVPGRVKNKNAFSQEKLISSYDPPMTNKPKFTLAALRKKLRVASWTNSRRNGVTGRPVGALPVSSNDHLMGFAGTGPRGGSIVRTRIEPKTFFAAERTFLAWLHIAVLVMMTGLGLLTGSALVSSKHGVVGCTESAMCNASRISGAIIAPMSVLFMCYALIMYKKRSIQILRRETVRYDDQRGPVVLTVLLVACTIISIVLAINSFSAGQ